MIIESPMGRKCGLLSRSTGGGGDEAWRTEAGEAGALLPLRLVLAILRVGRLQVWMHERIRIRFKPRRTYMLKRVRPVEAEERIARFGNAAQTYDEEPSRAFPVRVFSTSGNFYLPSTNGFPLPCSPPPCNFLHRVPEAPPVI